MEPINCYYSTIQSWPFPLRKRSRPQRAASCSRKTWRRCHERPLVAHITSSSALKREYKCNKCRPLLNTEHGSCKLREMCIPRYRRICARSIPFVCAVDGGERGMSVLPRRHSYRRFKIFTILTTK